MSVRILIADDQPLVRAGLRTILEAEEDFEIVGEASTGGEATALALRLRPDVVLMDVRMPGRDGLEATRALMKAALDPPVHVLVLTTFDLDEYVFEALRAGASGFMLKDAPSEDLVTAVRVAARGEALLAPAITRRLIDRFVAHDEAAPVPPPAGLEDLTPRERDVLDLLVQGLSNSEIATILFLGEATVKTHVANVLLKLGVRDRVQVVILAYESGLAPMRKLGGSEG